MPSLAKLKKKMARHDRACEEACLRLDQAQHEFEVECGLIAATTLDGPQVLRGPLTFRRRDNPNPDRALIDELLDQIIYHADHAAMTAARIADYPNLEDWWDR